MLGIAASVLQRIVSLHVRFPADICHLSMHVSTMTWVIQRTSGLEDINEGVLRRVVVTVVKDAGSNRTRNHRDIVRLRSNQRRLTDSD